MAYKRPRPISPSGAQKRSRGGADGAQNVKWGTPLPLDEDGDDGSFVPVWKQTVTDEKGRRRLHGAFTGGFSAGYFNTVGSKEGWTPKAFVSSRSNRVKDQGKTTAQRPEDYMDEEDLTEAAESRTVETTHTFAKVGQSGGTGTEQDSLFGLMTAEDDTMAVKLLQRMGWRQGQGVGSKIRREARLGTGPEGPTPYDGSSEHLFAPRDEEVVSFAQEDKSSRKGVGYESGARAMPRLGDDNLEELALPFLERSQRTELSIKPARKKTGFGVGILNDDGSDEEDPYAVGPKISYNKVLGKEKKPRKASKFANSALGDRHVFVPRKAVLKSHAIVKTTHDGQPTLKGFVLASNASVIPSRPKFPPPQIPPGWFSSKKATPDAIPNAFKPVAETAKSNMLDAKARATLLGEASLPGKSLFDYMSKESRDHIAAITGNHNLPQGRGESFPVKRGEAAQQKDLWSFVPTLGKDIAAAALVKGATGWMPYAEDLLKRGRYIAFLELCTGAKAALPERVEGMSVSDWVKELQEFAHAAQVFRPVQGLIASRFTSSTTDYTQTSADDSRGGSLLSKPTVKVEDPAKQAAKLGMYGPMTRSVIPFHPTRLLCKRFNVKPPPDTPYSSNVDDDGVEVKTQQAVSKATMDKLFHEALNRPSWITQQGDPSSVTTGPTDATPAQALAAPVDMESNDTLAQDRPPEDVFRAIFGDDDDD